MDECGWMYGFPKNAYTYTLGTSHIKQVCCTSELRKRVRGALLLRFAFYARWSIKCMYKTISIRKAKYIDVMSIIRLILERRRQQPNAMYWAILGIQPVMLFLWDIKTMSLKSSFSGSIRPTNCTHFADNQIVYTVASSNSLSCILSDLSSSSHRHRKSSKHKKTDKNTHLAALAKISVTKRPRQTQ